LSASAEWTGGKQQLTSTRWQQLLVGEGHRVGVTLVKEAVAEWKRQRREVFIPLSELEPGTTPAREIGDGLSRCPRTVELTRFP
jgi:hypothetical protein